MTTPTASITPHSADCPAMGALMESGVIDHSRRETDAWDQEFIVECDGEGIAVISIGPDGAGAPDDDIRP